MKPAYFAFILCFLISSSILQSQIVTDSLIREVIQSIYPTKSYLKLKIEELPSIIDSKSNWENEMDKYFILKTKGFDSLSIESQLLERQNINVDSIMQRTMNLSVTTNNNIREVKYILFSKDLNMVIIKELSYCGEDCGSVMTILYKKNKRGDWIFEKSIIGGIF